MQAIGLSPSRDVVVGGSALAIRTRDDNPNHHLWNNNGTWFVHYTVHPDALTSERVRRSLGTRDLVVARERRDQLLFGSFVI